MNNKHIEELLQQCIAAFDSGLSPEECLSAYPEARAELEPLFRQAISLRVAFAAAPRPEFRQRTRERVLFMAGRDVSAAFAARPDPEFVKDARQRFIRAAGAEAQEALRAVPPPRLPFWMNTRRRLLERAAVPSSPRPVARPMGGIFALRTGLSMAVVVLAMAVAGLAYLISADRPATTNAQFAQAEQTLQELQERKNNNQLLDPAKVQQLTAQVTQLVEQPRVNEKLPELIKQQQDIIKAAASEGLLAQELAQAQTQQLQLAEEKAELRLAAARADDPTATPPPSTSVPATQPGAATTRTAVPSTATAVATPAEPEPGVALTNGQIRVTPSGSFGGKNWKMIELANMSFEVPDSWQILGGIELDEGAYGYGVTDVSRLIVRVDASTQLFFDVETGRINVLTGNGQFTLRVGGIGGDELFASQEVLQAQAGELVGDLRRVRDTFEPAGALLPTPTPTPTATNTPSPSVTPAPPTNTPAPSATP